MKSRFELWIYEASADIFHVGVCQNQMNAERVREI